MTDQRPRDAEPLEWLADIARCGEAALAKWQEAHRNEETLALRFEGADGPFYEGVRSVVERIRDYHFEATKRAAWNLYITHCVHGLDLRLNPRCYLCQPIRSPAPLDVERLANAYNNVTFRHGAPHGISVDWWDEIAREYAALAPKEPTDD